MNGSQQSAARVSRALLLLLAIYAAIAAASLVVALAAPRDVISLTPGQVDYAYTAMQVHGVAAALAGLAFVFLRRGPRCPRAMPRLVCLAGIAFLFVSADRWINVFDPPAIDSGGLYRFHPVRGWYHFPNRRTKLLKLVRTDSYGLRVDYDGPVRKIEGRRRILFLGDSLTFGYGVMSRESFPRLVVSSLNERHAGLDVVTLNAGVTGYDTRMERHLLKEIGLPLKPSLVVYQVCLNDLTRQFSFSQTSGGDSPAELIRAVSHTHWSGLYRAFMKLGERLRYGGDEQAVARAAQHLNFMELLEEPPSEKAERAWDIMIDHVRGIVDKCRDNGIPLVVVVFPTRRQIADPGVSTWPQRRICDFAGELGLPALDLTPAFRSAVREKGLAPESLMFDRVHPTDTGHKIAAAEIVDLIEQTGLVDELLALGVPGQTSSH